MHVIALDNLCPLEFWFLLNKGLKTAGARVMARHRAYVILSQIQSIWSFQLPIQGSKPCLSFLKISTGDKQPFPSKELHRHLTQENI